MIIRVVLFIQKLACQKIFIATLIVIVYFFSYQDVFSQIQYTHPSSDDEFVGPFSSWINVKIKYGAVGNGITDDTRALQAAFDAIGSRSNSASVVYLPPGDYRISTTLKLNNKLRIGIVGADPSTTKITWSGSQNGTMLLINGTADSHFNRITWDGKNVAKIAVDQSWDGLQEYFDSGNEYADDVFTDVACGIHGGFAWRVSFAEVAIMRCKFIRNSVAGVSLGNFNALDIWIWNSIFEDCAIGVTNTIDNGAGGFKVYNCVFRRSAIADIKIGNTVEFSFRDNTSTNSKAFIIAVWTPNPAPIIIQGNRIIDPVDQIPIRVSNQGQITLLDNVIRSRPNAVGPVVVVDGAPNSDFFAIGNTFTVVNPIQADRSIIYTTAVVSRNSLENLVEPKLPDVQPNLNRLIFEVPLGSNAAAIQKIVNKAATLSGQRPIVHFPYGNYNIDSSITIPAESDLQLVGDSYWCILYWKGDNYCGPILKIEGPTKVTIRDLAFDGSNTAGSILVTNADQVGSRIFTHESEAHGNKINYSINGLDNTTVLLTNAGYTEASQVAISVIGGSIASSGNPKQGRTIVYAGCGTDNNLTCEVTNGGNLLVRDAWYESKYVNKFVNLPNSGFFTVEGSHIQTHSPSTITSFFGKATFFNSYISNDILLAGNGNNTKLLALGMLCESDIYIKDSISKSSPIISLNNRSKQFNKPGSGSYPIANIGELDQDFITTMLESVRNVHATILTPLPPKTTDLRLYRVFVSNSTTGIEFQGSNSRPRIEWNDH